MTTSYTNSLRLALQAIGDNSGTWGDVANNSIVKLLEAGIAGFVSVNLTGSGDYSLSVANGSTDEARNMIMRLGGTPAAARNVIIPAVPKVYIVECTVSALTTMTIKASGGSGINFLAGDTKLIYCDGLNTYSVSSVNLTALGITATLGEINVLDGITATVAELNVLDGITATVAELNVLDGITATVAELNVLDGITATVAELNILDGVSVSAGHINFLHDVSVSVQSQLNTKIGVGSLALRKAGAVYLVSASSFSAQHIFNITSISKIATGIYTLTFTSAIAGSGLTPLCIFGPAQTGNTPLHACSVSADVSRVNVTFRSSGGSVLDPDSISLAVF